MEIVDTHLTNCEICNKSVYYIPQTYAYKRINKSNKKLYIFCSYTCMRKFDKLHEKPNKKKEDENYYKFKELLAKSEKTFTQISEETKISKNIIRNLSEQRTKVSDERLKFFENYFKNGEVKK